MLLEKTEKAIGIIEVLVAITVLAGVVSISLAFLNPQKRAVDSRNAERWRDVNNIFSSLHDCLNSYNNELTACGINEPTKLTQIGTDEKDCGIDCGSTEAIKECVDLETVDSLDKFIKDVPIDPQKSSGSQTGYAVRYDKDAILRVEACFAEGGEKIMVSRKINGP